jgi:hypothetical protein
VGTLLRRRHAVIAALLTLSALAVVGVWAWLNHVMTSGQAAGINVIALTVRANGLAYQATWAYLAGALAVHVLTGLWARRQGDREAWIGVLSSAFIHLVALVLLGVLAPPG